MSRRTLVLAGLAAAASALLMLPAGPASADGLLPSPLPTLPPIQIGPISTAPVTQPVNQVVSGVSNTVSPATAPVSRALGPSQPGQAAPAASGGGGGGSASSAGGGGTGGGDPASASAPPPRPQAPPRQPSPAEQAALPAEPPRLALEGQQTWLSDSAAGLDQQDGAQALAVDGGDGRFTWPITFRGHPPITQRFGCTGVPNEPYSPDCVTHRFHSGIDLGVVTGTPVYASAAGVAHVFSSGTGYGSYVLIAHGNNWFTLYAHLSQFLVHEGDVVRRGDPVGLSGSTGNSTGPHLHFEVRYGQQPQDPCAYLGC